MHTRLTYFFVAAITLAVVQNIAVAYTFYYIYPWFDIPMHMLGGLTVALGFSILPFFGIALSPRYERLAAYLAAVFVVGIFWEIFEYLHDISTVRPDEDVIIDTISDFIHNSIGGVLGYLIAQRTVK